MDYYDWNAGIFNYFFNSENESLEVLFSVDEDIIEHIGKSNNIHDADALNNFCKSVSGTFKFLKQTRDKKGLRISLKDIPTTIKNGIPAQTGIIAVFILAASKMGNDSTKHLSSRNYFARLNELFQIFFEVQITSGISNEYIEFINLFNSFADYLNNDLKGEKGIISFNKLYSDGGRKKEDYVGMPIYQSMISAKDRCLLSKYFDYIRNNHKILSLGDIDVKEYSRVFRAVYHHHKYKYKLEEKIKDLYENWNEEVCEIDSKTGIKTSILRPKYIYKIDFYNKSYVFFETLKYKKSLDEFKWNNNLFIKTDNFDDYYNPVSIKLNDINLSQEKISKISEKIMIKRSSKKFILFQKNEESFSGHYLEVDKVEVGEIFSIIATPSFFKSNIEILRIITGNQSLEPIFIDNQRSDLMLIESILALKSNNSLGIFQHDKIQFKKGLKIKNKNEYLKNAEPLIYLEKKQGYGSIRYSIDNEKQEIYIDTPIDLRIKNNEIMPHKIVTDSKEKEYKIVDKLEENDFELIYKYFDSAKQNMLKELTEKENLINGCYIENYRQKVYQNRIDKILSIINKPNFSHNKFISKKLLAYATNINKSIDSKKYYKLNKYFKNKLVTDNIELKYLQVLEKDGVL